MIPKHAQILIDYIKATEKKLTSFETGLIATCNIFIKQNRLITDKQGEALEKCYRRVSTEVTK